MNLQPFEGLVHPLPTRVNEDFHEVETQPSKSSPQFPQQV